MRDIRIGAAQFEHRNADKNYNLSAMKQWIALAVDRGAEILSFHEACIPAYTFLRGRSKVQLLEIGGVKYGILTCFDNNLIENVRITTLMGAEVIFMPHVTCGLPSPMPGGGLVDKQLWGNRDRDPVSLRQEFMGPKGRGWLMRWLPARAYENGIYRLLTQDGES